MSRFQETREVWDIKSQQWVDERRGRLQDYSRCLRNSVSIPSSSLSRASAERFDKCANATGSASRPSTIDTFPFSESLNTPPSNALWQKAQRPMPFAGFARFFTSVEYLLMWATSSTSPRVVPQIAQAWPWRSKTVCLKRSMLCLLLTNDQASGTA